MAICSPAVIPLAKQLAMLPGSLIGFFVFFERRILYCIASQFTTNVETKTKIDDAVTACSTFKGTNGLGKLQGALHWARAASGNTPVGRITSGRGDGAQAR
jgi:hypothetical protein